MKHDASPRTLDIYVTPECFGCERAREIAKEIRMSQMPGVEVRLIDLSDPESVQPASVFAVPTYLLNGQVLSLGNPELDWLCQQLTA
jgi:hypothetical protein